MLIFQEVIWRMMEAFGEIFFDERHFGVNFPISYLEDDVCIWGAQHVFWEFKICQGVKRLKGYGVQSCLK